MSKLQPEPIDPAQLKDLALKVLAADRFPDLATIDGDQPRVRPVSPVRTDGFVVYIANLTMYHKTVEIAANPGSATPSSSAIGHGFQLGLIHITGQIT